jgi:hypothetical protein
MYAQGSVPQPSVGEVSPWREPPQPSLGGDCDNALGKAQRGRPTEMPLSQKGDCSEDATSYTSLNDGP